MTTEWTEPLTVRGLPSLPEGVKGFWVSNGAAEQKPFTSMWRLYRGLPRATSIYTVEELLRMGILGIYREAPRQLKYRQPNVPLSITLKY